MPPEELISQNGLDFVHWLEEDATNLVDDPDVGYVVANFSDVDDLLGHPAGDELLQRISRRFAAVVAEGVETTTQAGILREIGCGYAPGYLWSRPAPGADIPEIARRIDGNEPASVGPRRT